MKASDPHTHLKTQERDLKAAAFCALMRILEWQQQKFISGACTTLSEEEATPLHAVTCGQPDARNAASRTFWAAVYCVRRNKTCSTYSGTEQAKQLMIS